MDEYYSDNQPRLIHCDNCGEDYADTYRVCPFCHTGPNGRKSSARSSGRSSREGNRVRTNTRGGGYGGPRSPLSIVGIVLAVVLIVAAIIIVIVLAKALFTGGDKDKLPDNPSSSAITSQEPQPGEDSNPAQPIPPDGISLDQTELTLTAGTTGTLVAAIDPMNWIGQVIWSTSDANIATVDQSGVVTYVNEGTCTISASAAGVTADCTVTCAGTGEPAQPQEPTQSSIVVTAFGNTMDGDFTLRISEGAITFKASGGDGANYTWSMADPSIATVDPTSGKVTPLASGKTTMTVTSGGESTTVTIRVKD